MQRLVWENRNIKMSNTSVTERLTKLPRILPKPVLPEVPFIVGNPVMNPVILVPTNSKQILSAADSTVHKKSVSHKKSDAAKKRRVQDINKVDRSPTKSKSKRLDTSDSLQKTEHQSSDFKNKKGQDFFPPLSTNKGLDMLDSLHKAMEAEHQSDFQSETPPLPYLFETYRHWSHKKCLYEHGSRSYRRVEAVRATMNKYDIHDCVYKCSDQDMLDKFFECLESSYCFNEREITAFKEKLYMVHSEHWKLQKENKTNPTVSRICPYCRKFKTEDVAPLWQHIIKNHVEMEKVSRHKINIRKNKRFCTHCFQTGFDKYRDVVQHESRVHGIDTKNSCPFCGLTCGHNDNLEFNQHIIALHGRIFQCPTCKEEFCDRSDLNDHTKFLCTNIQKSDLVQKFFCPFCNVRFSSYEEVFKHLFNTYNTSKPSFDPTKELQCFACELKFDTHKELELHLKHSRSCCCAEFHSVSNRHVQCFSCKQIFQSNEALEFHQSEKARWLRQAPRSKRPLNFKSQKFKVTCNVKRLKRSDLANYPKALNRMLQAFEAIHSLRKDMPSFTETAILREDSMSPKLGNSTTGSNLDTNLSTWKDEYKEKRITEESDHARSFEPSQEAVGSGPYQSSITQLKISDQSGNTIISDKSGNTVIINNQQGGSNTIILGNCCSVSHQMCSKQQYVPDNAQNAPHSQTDMQTDKICSQTCNEQCQSDGKLKVDEIAVVHDCDNIKVENINSSQKKCLPKSVIKENEVTDKMNDFKVVARSSIEQNYSDHEDDSLKKAKYAGQDHVSVLRGIVREELNKYLQTVEEKVVPAASVQIRKEDGMNSGQQGEYSSLRQQSEVFLTDKNSMQQLYAVKSEPLECIFERNENQFQSKVDQEQGEMNNEHLFTEIKVEPMSPPALDLDTNCHSSHTFGVSDFALERAVPSDTMAVPFSKPSASHIHSELYATVEPVLDKINKEPSHADAKKSVTLSSVVQLPTYCQQMIMSKNTQRTILPKYVQENVCHSDETAPLVLSKTVGCLFPMAANSGYMAHLYEPSVSAASFLCNRDAKLNTPILPKGLLKVNKKSQNVAAFSPIKKVPLPPKIHRFSNNKDKSEKSSCNIGHSSDVSLVNSDCVQSLTKKTVSAMSTTALCTARSLPGLSPTKVSKSDVMSGQGLVTEPKTHASTTQSIVTTSVSQVVSDQITNSVSTAQAMSGVGQETISKHQTFQDPFVPVTVPHLMSGNGLNLLSAESSKNVPISGQNLHNATSVLSPQSLATAFATQPAHNITTAATKQLLPILNVPSLSTSQSCASLSSAQTSITQVVKGPTNVSYQVSQMQPQKVPIYPSSDLENVSSKKSYTRRSGQAESNKAITDCSSLIENSELSEENKSLNVKLCEEDRIAGEDKETSFQDLTVTDVEQPASKQVSGLGDTKNDNRTLNAKTIGICSSEEERSGSKTGSSPIYSGQEEDKITVSLETVQDEKPVIPQEITRTQVQNQVTCTSILSKQTLAAEIKVEPMQCEEDSTAPSLGHDGAVQQQTDVKNLVQPVGMQQNPQTTMLQPGSVQQNIVPVLQNSVGQGNNAVFINQGTPVAVQQNPWARNTVINTGLQQNFLSPVQAEGIQPRQVLQQSQMFYQAVQTPQGPVLVSQYINTCSGIQSGPLMLAGQQKQIGTAGTQISNVSGSQCGPKLFIGQQQMATTGTQNQPISGSQTGPFTGMQVCQPQIMPADIQNQLGSSPHFGPILLGEQQHVKATGIQNQPGSGPQSGTGLLVGQQEMVKTGTQNQPLCGSQSGPIILVRQQQVITPGTQNQPQYVLTGCQGNPVSLTGQNLVTLTATPRKRGKRKRKLPPQRQIPIPIKGITFRYFSRGLQTLQIRKGNRDN